MSAHAKTGLRYSLEGAQHKPCAVFLHGWPDDRSLWREQVAVFRDNYHCVLLELPNFGDSEAEPGGCDFDEIVARLHDTLAAISADPVVLITHDWGAYIGYLYEQKYPQRVCAMIAMDVGGHLQAASLSAVAMFVAYQWTLIGLWLIGGVVPALGSGLTRSFARLLKVPEHQARRVRSRCNYPYFYYWRAMLLPWRRNALLNRYQPQCPLLYIYGGRKPLMFHSSRWLEIVTGCGGQTECIADGTHWFMQEHPLATNEIITQWLKAR